MKSLLIVSSPRSLSTSIYEICCFALPELKPVPNVTRGEVFNYLDNPKCPITHYDRSISGYKHVCKTLREYNCGFILKSVVQPFHVSRYLDFHENSYNVLYIYRDRDAVKKCQDLRGWECVDPLIYEALFWKYVTVKYETLIYDPKHLFDALRQFNYQVNEFNYINNDYIRERESVLLKTGKIFDYMI